MKALYHINKWLVIVNAFLFIIPYLGLLFLILLGSVQIFMAIIIACKHWELKKDILTKFILYSVLSAVTLSFVWYISTVDPQNELSFNEMGIPIITFSIGLAFFHLHITYLIFKTKYHEISNS